jgi:hypothetical protein
MKALHLVLAASALMLMSSTQAQSDTSGLQLVPSDQVPRTGTFWLESSFALMGFRSPPLPWLPDGWSAPVYALTNGQFLIDDTDPSATFGLSPMAMMSASFSTDSGSGSGDPPPCNYQKFAQQSFSVIDTNEAATDNTNFYDLLITFPRDTNTAADLQIMPYGANAVLVRANHFDYSSETRDWTLVVCDKVETPLWKTVDLQGGSDAQDGWLVQGNVPNWAVTDPMYIMITNINPAYSAFFRAIPYSGPVVTLTGDVPRLVEIKWFSEIISSCI